MANQKLTDKTAATSVAQDDLIYIVDTSDTTDGASGTSKKATIDLLNTDYNVEAYGAKGDGIDLEDGNITSGNNAFSSASATFTASDVGKVIGVKGAGTSGAYLITTIATFVDANNITTTDNASTTVSSNEFFYGTDDTSNIQTTIQTCFDAGGGVVYFPNGVYIISGALQNNVGVDLVDYNSQLYIPQQDFTEQTVSIELLGEVHPHLSPTAGIGLATGNNKGVVLRSTITGSGTRPSIIASRGASGNAHEFNFTQPLFKNLSLQYTPDSSNRATIGGINCEYSATANFEYVTAYPYNLNLVDSAAPLNDVVGIAMPKVNSRHINTIDKCAVGGFEHGYLLGEHNTIYDATAVVCTNGYTQEANYHIGYYAKIAAFWCINDFNVNAASNFVVDSMQTEWSSQTKWYDNVYTVNDPNNYGIGSINYNIVAAGVGLDNTKYTKNGGNGIKSKAISIDPLIKDVSTTTYSFSAGDADKDLITTSNASAVSLTIEPDSTYNFDIGAKLKVMQNEDGQVTFVAGSGVSISTSSSLKTASRNSVVIAEKIANNTWVLSGDLEFSNPTLISATVNDGSADEVVMVFSEVVNGTNLGFTLSGTTSTSFSSITGFGTNTLTGTLAADVTNGETVLLSYDSGTGDIISLRTLPLESFTNTAVTNNVGASFTTNLVAAYQFESNFNDYTTNHNATATGTVTNNTSGKVGNAADFQGTADYLTVTSDNELSFGNGTTNSAASITTWLYLDTFNASEGVVIINKRGATSGTDEWIWSVSNNDLYFTLYDKDSNGDRIAIRTTSTPISTGTWYHLAVTYDGGASSSGLKMYIDGSLVTTSDNSAGTFVVTNNGGNNVLIGTQSWNPGAGDLDGKLDEMKIYKGRELTAGEISTMYTSENAGTSVL